MFMEDNKDKIIHVPVEDILPNRFQPRLAFDEKELNELAASIAKYGIIQPIVLRNIGDKYEIIAGERRFKASQLVGLTKVPAIINNTDDNTSAEIALLENLQRKNLTPIEEAQSYKKLIDRGFTQEEIATKLGVSQSSIANKMRLLNLPKRVQDALLYGKISERHARSLLSLNNQDLQLNLLERIIDERLTVKQTEDEISLLLNKNKYNNDIPDEIQKFLNPSSEVRFMKQALPVENKDYNMQHLEELLSVKEPVKEPDIVNIPDVVEIIEDPVVEPIKEETREEIKVYEKEMESINPFQSGSVPVSDRLPINRVYDNIYSEIIKNENIAKEEIKETEVVDNNRLVLQDGSVNIPKVIGKVREFVNSLDELKGVITTSEVDYDGKYQIIIEIDKK
jgi:ParB family chromosome partitioning protein